MQKMHTYYPRLRLRSCNIFLTSTVLKTFAHSFQHSRYKHTTIMPQVYRKWNQDWSNTLDPVLNGSLTLDPVRSYVPSTFECRWRQTKINFAIMKSWVDVQVQITLTDSKRLLAGSLKCLQVWILRIVSVCKLENFNVCYNANDKISKPMKANWRLTSRLTKCFNLDFTFKMREHYSATHMHLSFKISLLQIHTYVILLIRIQNSESTSMKPMQISNLALRTQQYSE